jgi:8-oxo-dGTP pyrophosphatase MutT (NUDIX family)
MDPAIPAATLILLRDRPGLPPEIPMVARGAHLVFAANRMVFPGGRVDEDDRVIAASPGLLADSPAVDAEELAHRVTAIRETIEEIGLAPGIEGLDDIERLAAIRAALHAGESFSAILDREGLRIASHVIHPFSRWRPDHEMSRRFDTRFYVARAPAFGEAVADGTESSRCCWGSAQDHIRSGGLIFPTLRTLERLGSVRHFDDVIAIAERYPMVTVTPWIEEREGQHWLHIRDDLGYPVTRQLIGEVDRDSDPSRPSSTRTPG